jgi:hypothetical protein
MTLPPPPPAPPANKPPLHQINAWADYWFYDRGVNTIPADTKNKRTYIKWSQWQMHPIPEEQFEAWKRTGARDCRI